MKSLIIFFLITYVFTLENKEHHQKIVETVNNFKTTWKAQLNQRDYTSLINTLKSIPEIEYPEKITFKASNEDLPESYDLREAFSQCESVNEIKDDTQCPASWAYGAIETMNDRICIHSKGQLQTKLSLLYLITCCTKCGTGCTGGGIISSAFEFWKNNGIPSESQYEEHMDKFEDNVDPPTCDNKYQNEDKSYAKSVYSVKGEQNMMKEIYENGSIEGTFTVYEDFFDYKSGIYQHITGASLGGLAIKIIGWGITDTGIKYWTVANCWGTNWGERGFFRIIRGKNECGIEEVANTGIPKL